MAQQVVELADVPLQVYAESTASSVIPEARKVSFPDEQLPDEEEVASEEKEPAGTRFQPSADSFVTDSDGEVMIGDEEEEERSREKVN